MRFIASTVEEIDLESLPPAPDFAVVDPPRAGLSNRAFAVVKALAPERIMYVSCDPISLGRDVAKFNAAGWRTSRLTVVDMFPQTYHVETVVLLVR